MTIIQTSNLIRRQTTFANEVRRLNMLAVITNIDFFAIFEFSLLCSKQKKTTFRINQSIKNIAPKFESISKKRLSDEMNDTSSSTTATVTTVQESKRAKRHVRVDILFYFFRFWATPNIVSFIVFVLISFVSPNDRRRRRWAGSRMHASSSRRRTTPSNHLVF